MRATPFLALRTLDKSFKIIILISAIVALEENKFTLLVQSFAQEISIAVLGYGGYVFKYEGDAVIVLFPA